MINYKRSEATEQIAVIKWCHINVFMYPELELIYHVPNGGKRNQLEAAKLKQQGVKAGVPDLFLPSPKHGYHGLYIEMKYGQNKTTSSQREWLKKLKEQGYLCRVCYGAEEAINLIKEYVKGERTNGLKKALGYLYKKYGNNEVVVSFSQYIDKLVLEEQRKLLEGK